MKGRLAANKILDEKYGAAANQTRLAGAKGAAAYSLKYDQDDEFRKSVQSTLLAARKKAWTDDARTKRMQSLSKLDSTGAKNSQYGTMWITNGCVNKKIKKDVDIIPEGWYKGRKLGI